MISLRVASRDGRPVGSKGFVDDAAEKEELDVVERPKRVLGALQVIGRLDDAVERDETRNQQLSSRQILLCGEISALPTNETRNGSQRLATDSMPTLQDIRGTYTQKAAGLPSSPVLRELHRLATLFIGHVITPDLRTII